MRNVAVKPKKNNRNLNDMGEAAIIQLIESKCASRLPSHILKGIGDDCAVLKTDGNKALLVTTDTMIEGVHFTDRIISAECLGWKALAVNVSDIAAMGGTPHTAFLSIGLKPKSEANFLESFMLGFQGLAKRTGIILAGGDTVESPSSLVVTITLLGDCPQGSVIYRSGAQVGDDVWVSGQLGKASAGLFLLQSKSPPWPPEYESLVQAHQRPQPPLELAEALGERGLLHAMIDLSDGIGKDLGHICDKSSVGALLQASAIPMSDSLMKLGKEVGMSPLQWALNGGEDYQLLFTAPPHHREHILSLTAGASHLLVTRIGAIIQDGGIWLETAGRIERLESKGFRHFAK